MENYTPLHQSEFGYIFNCVFVAALFIVAIILMVYLYRAWKENKEIERLLQEYEKHQQEKERITGGIPLVYDKHTGFNRPPTLAEAMQYKVDHAGENDPEFEARLSRNNGVCTDCD